MNLIHDSKGLRFDFFCRNLPFKIPLDSLHLLISFCQAGFIYHLDNQFINQTGY